MAILSKILISVKASFRILELIQYSFNLCSLCYELKRIKYQSKYDANRQADNTIKNKIIKETNTIITGEIAIRFMIEDEYLLFRISFDFFALLFFPIYFYVTDFIIVFNR